jgi:hypothetical protein
MQPDMPVASLFSCGCSPRSAVSKSKACHEASIKKSGYISYISNSDVTSDAIFVIEQNSKTKKL